MKKYRMNHKNEMLYCFIFGILFLLISILMTLATQGTFDKSLMKILCALYFISIMFLSYGFYHKFVRDEIIINDGIIQNRKFITENEFRNNFSNCIEYDISKSQELMNVILKTMKVSLSVKVRRGIDSYSIEGMSFILDKKDVEPFIKDISEYLDSIKVKL